MDNVKEIASSGANYTLLVAPDYSRGFSPKYKRNEKNFRLDNGNINIFEIRISTYHFLYKI
jgi:hypothetical protein